MRVNRLFLLLVLACSLWSMDCSGEALAGTITGRVMIKDGLPMANGLIYIFNSASGPPPSFDFRYWRVPDEVARIDKEGRFTAVLPEGVYYLGAIRRTSGEELGPLQDGDMFLPLPGEGESRQYTITSGPAKDVGMISGAVTFRKASVATTTGINAIEGRVIDSQGKPLENILVLAFTNAAMMGKPLFISEKTAKDGRYLLRVHQGGKYFLKIRSAYGGGALQPGDIMGSYGKEEPVAVEVKTGAIVRGIDITGSPFKRQGQNRK